MPQTSQQKTPQKTRAPRRKVDGILLLDKPLGLSSNTALQIVRRLYNADKAGHTGNLDPLATGLLPVCLGHATKLGGYLLDGDKRYRARVRLGQRTGTGDAEGEVVATSDAAACSREQLEAVLPRFLGPIEQVPPMYSALKRDGLPLYALARAGVEVERAPRQVTIRELRILDYDGLHFEFEVACSKGTYIRTLAEDWAAAAGQQAHLAGLRRTGAAPFEAAAMVGLEQLEAMAEGERDGLLLPPGAALAGWTRFEADAGQAHRLSRGQVLGGTAVAAGLVAVHGPGGGLLGIAESDGRGGLAPRRWMADLPEVVTAPAAGA